MKYFYFFIIMVTRMCGHNVEKIRKVYRRFISLEGAFGKLNGAKNSKSFNIKMIHARSNHEIEVKMAFSLF